jgi:hypothetical protein
LTDGGMHIISINGSGEPVIERISRIKYCTTIELTPDRKKFYTSGPGVPLTL